MNAIPQDLGTDSDWRETERRALADIHLASRMWVGLAASAVMRCITDPVAEAWMFSWTQAHWVRHGEILRTLAKEAHADTGNLTDDYPLLVTLAKYRNHPNPPAVATTLLRLVLECHLRSQHQPVMNELMEPLRGLLRAGGRNPLDRTIGAATSVPKLLSMMDDLEASAGQSRDLTGHAGFDRLWRRELQAICRQIATRPSYLVDDDTADDVEVVGLSDPFKGRDTGADPEDAAETPMLETAPRQPGARPIRPRTLLAGAIAWVLQRRSSADVSRDPENILPFPLVSQCWKAACDAAQSANEDGLADQVVHLLAIETGLSEREAMELVFGGSASEGVPVLDLEGCSLRRPEMRPDAAYEPDLESGHWEPTGGDIVVPISDAVVDLGRRLQSLRDANGATNRHLAHVVSDRNGSRPILRAIRRACPGLGVTSSMYLRRLAAGVAAAHGYGVAQLAFGQTFGLSPAPAYYGRIEAAGLASCIWRLGHVAACEGHALPAGYKVPTHHIGSRVAPKGKPILDLFNAMEMTSGKASARGRPTPDGLLAEWPSRRDRLAAHLMLAVAHRPGQALEDIRIRDFVAGKPLVVLGDKKSDPAHLTRVASTGWSFVAELDGFKAYLRKVSRSSSIGKPAEVAKGVLSGEIPLFTLANPDGTAEAFNMKDLAARFPEPWAGKQNLHRHLLCQELARLSLDPELIYFQMGWIGGDVHATGDMAPLSPLQLAEMVAPLVDQALARMGWKVKSQAKRGVSTEASSPFTDWTAAIAANEGDARKANARLRQNLKENRREAEPEVANGMKSAVAKALPDCELVQSKGRQEIRPRVRPTEGVKMVIGRVSVAMVLDHFRDSRFTSLHRVVAVRQLAAMLRQGVKNSWYEAYIPAVPLLSKAQEPSPFLRGSGLAVAQASEVRCKIPSLCTSAKSREDLACAAVIALMSCTRHRSLEEAFAIVSTSHLAVHAEAQPDVLRIPFGSGHVSITGVPALVLRRLTQESMASAIDRDVLGGYIEKSYPHLCRGIGGRAEIVRRFEQTMSVAGRLELDGVARTLSLGRVSPALVTAERAASVADGMTIPGRTEPKVVDDDLEELGPRHVRAPRKNPSHKPLDRDVVREVISYFNPDYSGKIDGKQAKLPRPRNAQVAKAIESRIASMGRATTSSLALLEYMLHLARNGGPKSQSGMKGNSVYTMLGRFARPFDELCDGSDLELIDANELERVMVGTIKSAPSQSQPKVLKELRAFHRFCLGRYDIESPNWTRLQIIAGEPCVGSDPAVLGDHEVGHVLDQLQADMGATEKATPRQKRLCELRFVSALLADGSGARPRSIHALTLADLHLDPTGDCIHLRARGRFASVKTNTSAGFIRLEGDFWRLHRRWVVAWLEARRSGHEQDSWQEIPLFQIPQEDEGQRYKIRQLFGRIGELVRWASGQQNGRTYWFRKRRILARYSAVYQLQSPLARDVGRVMAVCGHAGIVTPLASYLADLAMLRPEDAMPQGRAEVAEVSRISPAALDRREVRRKGNLPPKATLRIAAALALGPPTWASEVLEELGPAPMIPLTVKAPDAVVISLAMEQVARGVGAGVVADRIGMDEESVVRIGKRMGEFTAMTGIRFSEEQGAIHRPRRVGATTAIFDLLGTMDPRIVRAAKEWAALVARVGIDDGCPMVSADILAGLREALEEREILLVDRVVRGVATYMPISKAGAKFGLWPALCWVLAVVNVVSKEGINASD